MRERRHCKTLGADAAAGTCRERGGRLGNATACGFAKACGQGMAYAEHDFCHLVKGDKAGYAGKCELCGGECGCHSYGVSCLAGYFHESAHRVAYEAQEVGECQRGSVECLLGRAAHHLDERRCRHGGGASDLGLATAFGSCYAG